MKKKRFTEEQISAVLKKAEVGGRQTALARRIRTGHLET